jgi:hypothetical protein
MSSKANLDGILKGYKDKGLTEVEEVVGEWAFAIDDLPVKLKIKVVYVKPQGKFMGITNYKIKNPEQLAPYQSLDWADTVEKALNDALKGFLVWWLPEKYKDNTRFVAVKDW